MIVSCKWDRSMNVMVSWKQDRSANVAVIWKWDRSERDIDLEMVWEHECDIDSEAG